MSFYAEIANTANDLLAEFGQLVTITHTVSGSYNPSTGSVTNTTRTETGVAALLNYPLLRYGINEIEGTQIVAGDKRCLMSPNGITQPSINDTVLANGITYTIKNVKASNPAGTPVLYDLLLRVS